MPDSDTTEEAIPNQFCEAEKKSTQPGRPSQTPFSKDIRTNFCRWDKDHDGILQEGEVDAAILDAKEVGSSAAAATAAKKVIHCLEDLSQDVVGSDKGITLKDIEQYESGMVMPLSSPPCTNAEFIHDFGSQRIASAPSKLYPHKDPSPADVQQGIQGDCYFLAAVAAMAHADPKKLKGMIKDKGNGAFEVTFPGHPQAIQVNAPTDAVLAMGGSETALWVIILECAAGKVRDSQNPIPIAALDHGGEMGWSLELLTGRKSDTTFVLSTGNDPNKVELDAREKLLQKRLTSAFQNGKLVTAGSFKDKSSEGIVALHAYSVESFDPKTNKVTLRNPWGDTEPVDAAGLVRDGSNDGLFTMSLVEFMGNFAVTVES